MRPIGTLGCILGAPTLRKRTIISASGRTEPDLIWAKSYNFVQDANLVVD